MYARHPGAASAFGRPRSPFRRIQTTEYLKAFIDLKSLIYWLLNSGQLIANFQKHRRLSLLTDSEELLVTVITKPLICSEFPLSVLVLFSATFSGKPEEDFVLGVKA